MTREESKRWIEYRNKQQLPAIREHYRKLQAERLRKALEAYRGN